MPKIWDYFHTEFWLRQTNKKIAIDAKNLMEIYFHFPRFLTSSLENNQWMNILLLQAVIYRKVWQINGTCPTSRKVQAFNCFIRYQQGEQCEALALSRWMIKCTDVRMIYWMNGIRCVM